MQLTPTSDCAPGDDTLGYGICAGDQYVVYNYGSCSRPGIYIRNLTTNQESILCQNCWANDDLRMDGCSVVWPDYYDGSRLYRAVVRGAECTSDAGCDKAAECRRGVCTECGVCEY